MNGHTPAVADVTHVRKCSNLQRLWDCALQQLVKLSLKSPALQLPAVPADCGRLCCPRQPPCPLLLAPTQNADHALPSSTHAFPPARSPQLAYHNDVLVGAIACRLEKTPQVWLAFLVQ